MWKIFAIFIYFINVCNCQFVLCPGLEDEVTKIPGLNVSPNFRQFAGYLEATNNTFFYYWFFESQNQQSDPLVLWLNGGPGCSSVMGALTENGPFRLNKDGSLSFNDFSWNKRVNILYLESPAGVGFSYKNGGNNLITGDTETAINNHEALKSFFLKFPYLMENDFYIAGESYGGMYIPTLSSLIVQTQYPRNFKGIAIGNGYLDETLNGNSMLQYAYYHGLYDISLWKQLHNHCCSANETIADYCDYVSKQNRQCKDTISLINQQLYNQPLNLYDIYGKCEHNTNYAKSLFDVQFTREYAEKRYIKKRLLKLDGEVGDQTDPPCMNFGYADAWLNQKSVRSALNVRQESNYWTTCNPHITTTYVHEFKSMRQTIQYLHKKGLRILIYNGDADYMCAYLGDHWFVESLGLRTTKAYQPWMYKDQIGGYMKGFDNLIFATIRGAGHTVPTDRPGEILKLFYNFIDNKI